MRHISACSQARRWKCEAARNRTGSFGRGTVHEIVSWVKACQDALAAHMRMARESSVVDRSVENASPSSDGALTHVVLSVKLNDPEDLTGDELTTGERALSAEEREASTLYP